MCVWVHLCVCACMCVHVSVSVHAHAGMKEGGKRAGDRESERYQSEFCTDLSSRNLLSFTFWHYAQSSTIRITALCLFSYCTLTAQF